MTRLSFAIALCLLSLSVNAQVKRSIFDFEFEGFTLNGILNQPENQSAKGMVLIVQGSGRTDAVAREMYQDVRHELVKAGYATYIWDKMGCGKSEGIFDYNQSVQNSAKEVIAAIETLKTQGIPGADKIGFWGVSRAGWIVPLVIQEYKEAKFWISVSGVDAKENFGYLLEENLRIEGLPEDSIALLVKEWKLGNALCHSGVDYETAVAATTNLNENVFLKRFNNGHVSTEEEYYQFQKTFQQQGFDYQDSLAVYIENFEDILASISCPVLAIFGEKDKNVDWKKTKALYERVIGPNADLSFRTFPDGNHNLYQCKTGGFYEMQDDGLPWNRCEGYLEAISGWLKEKEEIIFKE